MKPTILVVDDDPATRALLSFTLAEHGTVLVAADAREGFLIALEHAPDVALVDVMMPGSTGLQLLRTWRTQRNMASVPVAVINACSLQDDEDAAYEAGADAFVAKPFDVEAVGRLVANLLAQPRLPFARPRRTLRRAGAPRRELAGV